MKQKPSSPKIHLSSDGSKFVEFGIVRQGRCGAPEVHLRCRITATSRLSPRDSKTVSKVPSKVDDGERCCHDVAFEEPAIVAGPVAGPTDLKCRPPKSRGLKTCFPRRTKESCPTFPTRCPWKRKCSSGRKACFGAAFRTSRCPLRTATEAQTRTTSATDDEEEDGSSGFFSDELSETDVDSVLSTSDKQIQCSLGRYTLSQAQRRERTRLTLVSHSELPEWLKNNEYLVRYHRPPLYSWRACARSIFSLHTESGNIWTHLLGALGFLALGVHFFRSDVLALDWAGCLAFGIYFAGAALCLTLSTTYHTFNCHSAKVGKFFCKMDYFGITVLILGSFYPWLYFQFLCEPLKRLVYGLLVTASGLLTMRVSLSHKFGEARYRALRAGIFFSFALVCGVLPSAHYGIQHGWNDLMYKSSFVYILLMVAIYVSGCCVYASRVPERFFPWTLRPGLPESPDLPRARAYGCPGALLWTFEAGHSQDVSGFLPSGTDRLSAAQLGACMKQGQYNRRRNESDLDFSDLDRQAFLPD
ncbi:adiponectin receptor protein [Rhipicephalus sanguineus]|uniref:adiponectin receptor protein n=1 Tax=Rhipicephalus sanguineus TaxID=34632 RepID=UPI001895F253|nr:adiponectin receptor protein [Rhipicephalus sanguineus]